MTRKPKNPHYSGDSGCTATAIQTLFLEELSTTFNAMFSKTCEPKPDPGRSKTYSLKATPFPPKGKVFAHSGVTTFTSVRLVLSGSPCHPRLSIAHAEEFAYAGLYPPIE